MPDLVSRTSKLSGFPKEVYFSQNMRKGELGAANLYAHASQTDSATLTNLADAKAMSDIVLDVFSALGSPVSAIAAQDTSGYIYLRTMGSSTWTEYYKPGHAASAIGIHWDGRYLYYMGTEHVGRFDSGQALGGSDTAGTLSVTNGSATVTGSGTNFNGAAQNGKRIKIGSAWYTISTATTTTALTLTTNYTGTTASGVSYQIFQQWNDTWQDCGGVKTGYLNFQPFAYEGDILFPRQGKICRYNYTDGSFSADSADVFDAPDSYYWRLGSGGQGGILLGLEPIRGNNSYLVLWDNRSNRSIAPWIPLSSKVQSIRPYNGGWIVVTEREILYTNGYSSKTLSKGVDNRVSEATFSVLPNGLQITDDKAFIANAIGGYSKKRSGIYVYDIPENSYEYIAPLGGFGYNVTPLAIAMDLNKTINVSCSTDTPAKKYLGTISDSVAAKAYVITDPLSLGGNDGYLGFVKTDFGIVEGSDTITGSITAKVANLKRRLFGIQKAKTAGADTTHIVVDGTALNDVQVGDEVCVLEGANAGMTSHITAISGTGTSTETWTLDTALGTVIEINCYVSVTPFQKLSTKTITSQTELRGLLFNGQNRIKGRDFLVKIDLSNMTVPVELLSVELVAQDQGIKKS